MQILLFARLRDVCNCATVTLDIDNPSPVAAIRTAMQGRFPEHADLFSDSYALVAVNQEMITDDNTLVSATDEIAFFPPVTGG